MPVIITTDALRSVIVPLIPHTLVVRKIPINHTSPNFAARLLEFVSRKKGTRSCSSSNGLCSQCNAFDRSHYRMRAQQSPTDSRLVITR